MCVELSANSELTTARVRIYDCKYKNMWKIGLIKVWGWNDDY